MDIHDQLAALNPQPGERFSINHYMAGWPSPRSSVLTPEAIPAYVSTLPLDADIWIGMNPVGAWVKSGRGTAADVTRLTSLYCDLDVKEGGCASLVVAEQIIHDLCVLLGEDFVTMVYSGHGIQPTWAIDPGETATNAEMAALLRRWGQLVKLVAKQRGAGADSVFDLARILRVVGTYNNKGGEHIEVYAAEGYGGPLTYAQISEKLDEAGIFAPPPVDYTLTDAQIPDKGWSKTECWYATQTFNGWLTDQPAERHPWLTSQFTRLESMRILGCLTHSQYQTGRKLLADRFAALRAGVGGTVRPFEVESCAGWGLDRARSKSMPELLAEVAGHQHDVFGDIVKDRGTQQVPPQPKAADDEEPHTDPTPDDLHRYIFEAEGDFWYSRDSLKMIFDAAMARMVSPWAVLAYSAARILQLVPSSVELPGLVNPHGSLNWLAIVVDKSGGGKSAAAAIAKEVVSVPFPQVIYEAGVGSGEGMIGQFFTPDPNDKKTLIRREAVMFTADEIDNLTAMSQRQGGTTLPMIRTAFSGGTLGHSYITKGRDIHVMEYTYRMTLVINAQPGRCASLLDDHGGGTPQRLQWFPANDKRPTAAQANENHYTPGVTLPTGMALLGRKRIQIPDEARDLIWAMREKQVQGETDGLDGHALFCREKFAYALALLDGRTDMGSEDWRLSGIAAEVSSRTRAWVQSELAHTQETEAEEQGRLRGVGLAASDAAKVGHHSKKVSAAEAWVLNRLREKGPQTKREMDRAWPPGHRGYKQQALDSLVADGYVDWNEAEKRWSLR